MALLVDNRSHPGGAMTVRTSQQKYVAFQLLYARSDIFCDLLKLSPDSTVVCDTWDETFSQQTDQAGTGEEAGTRQDFQNTKLKVDSRNDGVG